jgi:hypothetical protein
MPGFALFSRRYFGTLLVNSLNCIRSTSHSDKTSNILLVSAKDFTHSSTENNSVNRKNTSLLNSQR